jgi:hypothetical protein
MADPECPTSPEERFAAICQLSATAVRRHAADRKKLDFATMTGDQLRVRYEELWFDKPRSRNRTWLIRKIAWRLQSLELGGLTDRARQRATTLARTAEVRTTLPRHVTLVPREKPAKPAKTSKRDPRLPCVGASVVREYQG